MDNRISVCCDKKELSKVRQFVQSKLDPVNLSLSQKNQIILAVDEACANAIIHGNDCNQSHMIDVEVTISKDQLLHVKISDVGDIGFIKNWSETLDMKKLAIEKRKGGMGLHLIFKIMDDVKFYTKNHKGVCSLTKQLN